MDCNKSVVIIFNFSIIITERNYKMKINNEKENLIKCSVCLRDLNSEVEIEFYNEFNMCIQCDHNLADISNLDNADIYDLDNVEDEYEVYKSEEIEAIK